MSEYLCFKKSCYMLQEFSIHFLLLSAAELCPRTEIPSLDILCNCYFSHLAYAHL